MANTTTMMMVEAPVVVSCFLVGEIVKETEKAKLVVYTDADGNTKRAWVAKSLIKGEIKGAGEYKGKTVVLIRTWLMKKFGGKVQGLDNVDTVVGKVAWKEVA